MLVVDFAARSIEKPREIYIYIYRRRENILIYIYFYLERTIIGYLCTFVTNAKDHEWKMPGAPE